MSEAADPAHIMTMLQALGGVDDAAIDLGRTALYFAALEQPGLLLERYNAHLRRLATDVRDRFNFLLSTGAEDSAETRLAAIRDIFSGQHGYNGDMETYNDLQNASLTRVIDRRRGMPIALAIICIQIGRDLGWPVQGLNLPGHFVCRMDYGPTRLIFDPFNRCVVLQAAELRALIKKALGDDAELSATYYEAADNRTILTRLQNNIKLRRIESEDYDGALRVVEAMRAVDPEEYRLLLDAGVLYARTQRLRQAIAAIETYIDRVPGRRDREEAAHFLRQIKESLH